MLANPAVALAANDEARPLISHAELFPFLGSDRPWLEANIPFFECPDRKLTETYYFRWRVYHEHIQATPDGFVVTEFLPKVPWAGKWNTISCAAGHHFYEGRWLRDRKILDDYAAFWFRRGGEPRRYSFWAADALYARSLVSGDFAWACGFLPELTQNYTAWEKSNLDANGLFHQIDDRDGMEYSLGGSGYRPTINSYQYGDAVAISRLAESCGKNDVRDDYQNKARILKRLVQEKLWDPSAEFFKTRRRDASSNLVAVREEIGFVPWYFNLPDPGYEAAWKQMRDIDGFAAPHGIPTAERRSLGFMATQPHDCLWNGPAWPYATTQTLVALANLLNNYPAAPLNSSDYLALLQQYANSQSKDGHPWIAEDLDPITGRWIVDEPRSVDYNHSGFCDLIISGLIGIRPRADDALVLHPLVPEGVWDYFCLENAPYHRRNLTILYDKTGDRYHRGKGLMVLVDNRPIANSSELKPLTVPLAEAKRSPWVKAPENPVLGGDLGTCFDNYVLKEGDTYRMWFSWRPKKSVALVESTDGIHWSKPKIVLNPRPEDGWEEEVNRPGVVKRSDGYHLWYTGQAKGHSFIGHAFSRDGENWERTGERPVLFPELPWEKAAVMCPDVMWDETAQEFQMYYSGGEQYEPDAIGYATSPDGMHWKKAGEPIFAADPDHLWERHKVTACQVVKQGGWRLMFYIGFRDVDHAAIGIARSRDGVHQWERFPANPIIQPDPDGWDADACYKPAVVFEPDFPGGGRWLLWYNGRRGGLEQIGLVSHSGAELGF